MFKFYIKSRLDDINIQVYVVEEYSKSKSSCL